MDPFIQYTDHGDGSAKFTVSFADDDHRFSVAGGEDGSAVVDYEETLAYHGQIHVAEPDEEIFKILMTSEEMTEFLNDNGYSAVRRRTR